MKDRTLFTAERNDLPSLAESSENLNLITINTDRQGLENRRNRKGHDVVGENGRKGAGDGNG